MVSATYQRRPKAPSSSTQDETRLKRQWKVTKDPVLEYQVNLLSVLRAIKGIKPNSDPEASTKGQEHLPYASGQRRPPQTARPTSMVKLNKRL